MDKKAPKKNNKNVPHPSKQNNLEMQPKITPQNKARPITGIKPNQRPKINLSKKSNTPKKISVINLNEEVSIKESKKSKDNIHSKKINPKENVKKLKNVNSNNINNNINKKNNEIKDLNIIDQTSNLTSIYNALTFINLKLDSTFSSQKEEAERTLNDKYNEAIELKEKNFKLFQQINSMSNIIEIDDYFLNNYSKIMEVYPKVSNVVENMNDIVSNINYGLDRMYLVDDLLCDENILEKNIAQIKCDLEVMNINIEKKMDEINLNKKKYDELYNELMKNDEEIKNIESKLDIYKQNVLTNNIDVIYEKLSEKNKRLLNDILND
jgi:hypothetical protein